MTLRINLILILCSFVFTNSLEGQKKIEWQKCYGGSNSEPNFGNVGNKIQKTKDGGYIIFSMTQSTDGDVKSSIPNNSADIWVVKIDNLGKITWELCLGGNNYDNPYSVSETDDSSYIVMGTTSSSNLPNYHTNWDLYIAKINSKGILMWQKCYGGSNYDSDAKNNNVFYSSNSTPNHIIQKPNGNLVIVSETRSNNGDVVGFHNSTNSLQDIWALELDKLGNIVNQKCIGGSRFDMPFEIIYDENKSGYYILGATNSADEDNTNYIGGFDIVVYKVDTLFNILWSNCLGSVRDDFPGSILISRNKKSIYVSGIYDGPEPGSNGQIIIYNLDFDGVVLNSNKYGGINDDGRIGGSICPPILHSNSDSTFVFATVSNSSDGDIRINYGDDDIWLVSVDTGLNILWERTLGSKYNEYGNIDIQVDSIGEIILTMPIVDTSGNLQNMNYQGDQDIGVFMFDFYGNRIYYECFGGTYYDVPYNVIYEVNTNKVIVCGSSNSIDGDVIGNNGGSDIWVFEAKINQTRNVKDNNSLSNQLLLHPNPSSDILNLDFDSRINDFTVNIMNINGVQIHSSNNQRSVNVKDYSPGLYYLILKTETQILVKKWIKL